jgi:HSP20 family protein
MEDIRTVHLRHLQGRVRDIAWQLTRVQYSCLHAKAAWHPAINAYRCRDSVVIFVELAGVPRSTIELRVEPQRVCLSGRRAAPEPRASEGPPEQVLALEIDAGAFEREIVLPVEIDPEAAQAEATDGLLRIHLPLARRA